MRARVVITAGGQVSIFVDEGTLETGREAIGRFFARLAAQDMTVAWDGKVEQHCHEREATTSHVRAHENARTKGRREMSESRFPTPTWAQEVMEKCGSGVAHAFVLHFNIHDYAVPGVPFTTTMATTDVQDTLDIALEKTGVTQVKVEHRPRLLSDNGPCYVSKALRDYLGKHRIEHTRGASYHPMTQGKIERYHRSMKSIVKLELFYYPWELERAIANFVDYYNNHRYHEALDNLTPANVYVGRGEEIQSRREEIKNKTMQERRRYNLQLVYNTL